MAWFSSANRSPSRVCVVMLLSTHRDRQPFSRPDSALDVKSSTHETKQLSTRPEKSCFFTQGGYFCIIYWRAGGKGWGGVVW